MKYDIKNMDVLAGLRAMPDASFDMAFADPPYNLGIDYGSGGEADERPEFSYRFWCAEWIEELARLVRPGGAVWVLVNERNADHIGSTMSAHVGERRARVIWHERFAQYNKHNFTNEHRHLFYHVKPGAPHKWRTEGILVPSVRMQQGDKRAAGPRVPGDVWEVSRVQGNNKQRVDWHPAQLNRKPLERIVVSCTDAGDSVVEPFSGSGSMLLACMGLDRNYVGIDDNAEYVARAMDRARDYSIQLAGDWMAD